MQQVIPDDWDGESFCRWAVCWPNSPKWIAILHGQLEAPNQGRFWDFGTGHFLTLRGLFKQAYDYNFDLKEVIMACGDTGLLEGLLALADAQKEIAKAIGGVKAGGDCCDCTGTIGDTNGGMNGVLPDGTITYGTQPGQDYPTDVPPDGYDDMNHFNQQLCAKANALVDGILTVIRGVGAVTSFNAVGATVIFILGTVGLMVIAPPVIPVLITAMGVLWLASGTLLGLAIEVENHRQDIVCVLVTGDNMSNVTATLANVYDVIIAAVPLTGPYAIAAKSVLMTLTSSDTLNNLLAAYGGFNYPEADCGDCQQSGELVIYRDRGTITNQSGNTYTIQSELGDPFAMNRIAFGLDPESARDCFVVTSMSFTNYQPEEVQSISIWYYGDDEYTVLPAGLTGAEIAGYIVGEQVADIDLANNQPKPQYSVVVTIEACE